MVQSCLPSSGRVGLSNSDEDFVNLGMDSLKATKLRRMLNAALRNSRHTTYSKQYFPLDFIYAHPSVSRLAKALNSPINDNILAKDRTEVMKNFVSKYASPDVAVSLERPKCLVILTGSTGNLGAHLLAQLSTLENVDRIVCLLHHQRSPSTADIGNLVKRQSDALKGRGIELSEKGLSKVQFLPWNVDEEFLGLGHDGFQSPASHEIYGFGAYRHRWALSGVLETQGASISVFRATQYNRDPVPSTRVCLELSIHCMYVFAGKKGPQRKSLNAAFTPLNALMHIRSSRPVYVPTPVPSNPPQLCPEEQRHVIVDKSCRLDQKNK